MRMSDSQHARLLPILHTASSFLSLSSLLSLPSAPFLQVFLQHCRRVSHTPWMNVAILGDYW